jgi:hypothetical protein
MKKVIFTSAFVALVSFTTFAQSGGLFDTQSSTQRRSSTRSNSDSPFGTGLGTTNQNVRQQDGYYRSNGTYVQPHMKTESNSTNLDNFSTQGNSNPFTNERGSRARDNSSESLNYGQGRQIQTGERGGQYYINSNGNRTYVPKRSPY